MSVNMYCIECINQNKKFIAYFWEDTCSSEAEGIKQLVFFTISDNEIKIENVLIWFGKILRVSNFLILNTKEIMK